MKLISGLLLAMIIGILAGENILAQSMSPYFVISRNDSLLVTKSPNGEKTLRFEIAGLNSQQQLDEFVNKFKTLRGVISITVADVPVDNKWKATAVFYKFANKTYFQNLLNWCDISYIIIDNRKYETQNFPLIKFD
jgi:hypothetical protein